MVLHTLARRGLLLHDTMMRSTLARRGLLLHDTIMRSTPLLIRATGLLDVIVQKIHNIEQPKSAVEKVSQLYL